MPDLQILQGSVVVLVEREGLQSRMLAASLSGKLAGGLAEMFVRTKRLHSVSDRGEKMHSNYDLFKWGDNLEVSSIVKVR
jgi:hypothetical protein